ncbi:MAG TPA: 3-methyl-2-oxobutanoate hydroxymethyltransferase [Pseudobdellovibrionaceae bacterium]|nr:3-methyl-2-oxobutanoate hydroxymethyltransferase [Pseudobdellovibrionaceae bacterium]
MSILDFQAKKQKNEKISMLTCYDYSFARILNESPVDALLVGDSAAMVMHGHGTTLNIDIDTMAFHTAAVVRGAPNKLVIADLPFLSYRKDLASNVEAAGKLMKAGAQALKLEGAAGNLELVHHLVQSGIPIMGHLGLTPQSIHQLGGFKVQGREDRAAGLLREHAQQLQEAGCFSLVLECVPSAVATSIAKSLSIPVIGIGAGQEVDGQVLVLQDMLGMNPGFKPKFLRTYMNAFETLKSAFADYHRSVVCGEFPSEKESYS